jgi:anti-anti-sigma factor
MTGTTKTELLAKTELQLDGVLDIRRASELKERLHQAIEQSEAVEIDLCQVEKIDLCILQLFCSAHRTASDSNRSLRLIGPLLGPVRNVVAETGLNNLIDCPSNDEEH